MVKYTLLGWNAAGFPLQWSVHTYCAHVSGVTVASVQRLHIRFSGLGLANQPKNLFNTWLSLAFLLNGREMTIWP